MNRVPACGRYWDRSKPLDRLESKPMTRRCERLSARICGWEWLRTGREVEGRRTSERVPAGNRRGRESKGMISHGCSIVMDMVIFRTIFFELFSFLHVHAPYPPFRLLTNLGTHQRQDETPCIKEWPIVMVHKHKHVLLLL